MWKTSYSTEKPTEVDLTSSHKWVYVRKDFEFIEGDGEFKHSQWKYLEKKIAKEDWELFQTIQNHNDALDDVYAALTELAEMIVGDK